MEGSTDSEALFFLALTFGLEDDPVGAVARAVGLVEDLAERRGIGVVAVYTSHDPKGELSAPTTGQVGQTLYVQFSVAASNATRRPSSRTWRSSSRLDDKGTPMLVNAAKPSRASTSRTPSRPSR